MEYLPRLIDARLDELLPHLAAIAVEGAKAVGKTETARRRAATIVELDDPAQREAAVADPRLISRLASPVLIDEWQLVPEVWDRVRRAVDSDPTGGRFLLTGSAGSQSSARSHSGAGRIVTLTMRPMSLAERGTTTPTVSLRSLLDRGAPELEGTTTWGVGDYTDEILRSGFPGIRDLSPRARDLQLDGYVSRIVDTDLPASGVRVRRPASLRAWLAAYAAATSTDASYSTVLDAATAGESDKPARQTVSIYRDHLQRHYVLDPVPAWQPAFHPLARLTRTPKHHLVDPALAARLVGVGREGLLSGDGYRPASATGSWLGALFESLAVQSVRTYADGCGATVAHLRTRNTNHEIDIIVERPDTSVVAIEVKLAPSVTDADVRHLNWLAATLGDRVVDCLVVTTGPHAYRRSDGVGVVPLALLGP